MCSDCSGGVACGDEGPDDGAWWWDEDAEPAQPTGETTATGEKGSDVTMASEPMTDARLAEIRARAYTMYPLSSYPLEPNLVEWMGVASDDRCSLLAEVERLRAREAALVERNEQAMEIARDVVKLADDADESLNEDDDDTSVWVKYEDIELLAEQARALLASTEPTTAE